MKKNERTSERTFDNTAVASYIMSRCASSSLARNRPIPMMPGAYLGAGLGLPICFGPGTKGGLGWSSMAKPTLCSLQGSVLEPRRALVLAAAPATYGYSNVKKYIYLGDGNVF
jgi:hypothetical protein